MINASILVDPFSSLMTDWLLAKTMFEILVDTIIKTYDITEKTVVIADCGVLGMYYTTDERTHERIVKGIKSIFKPGLFIITEDRK